MNYDIASKNLMYLHIAEELRKIIRDGNLNVDDRLPSERELAATLKTSRASVREALRQLENQGVISVQPGRGAFVTERARDHNNVIMLVKEHILQNTEIKALLEGQVIRHAMEYVTPKTLDELETLAMEMMFFHERGIYPAEVDVRFHSKLAECTPNNVLKELLQSFVHALGDYWSEFTNDHWYKLEDFRRLLMKTVPCHLEIVRALRRGDQGAALEAQGAIYKLDIEMYNTIHGESNHSSR